MAKPKIVNQAGVQAYAEIELRDLLNNFNEIYVKKTTELRDTIEKDVKANLDGYQDYYDIAKEKGSKSIQVALEKFLNEANEMAVQGDDGKTQAEIKKVMDAWTKWIKFYNTSQQQSHQDFSVISGHLFVIYTGIQRIGDAFYLIGAPNVSLPKGGKSTKKRTFTINQFNALQEKFRRLWISAKAVAQMPIDMFSGDPIKDITLALEEYFKNTSQTEHIANKVKQVDVLTGKVSQTLKIERQEARSKAEQIIARSRGASRLGVDDPAYFKATKDVNWARLKGSNPLEGEIVKQFTEIAAGKKPKKYKTKTKAKKKNSSKIRITSKEKLRASLKKAAAVGLTPIKLRSVKRHSESGANNQREINKLKVKINQRLPAEVRRNMGRPALINRTSRFSNSAMLTELRQGPKTLIGKYTYMLNPYETFENEGQKQWPTGYNPKPLIAQSIRNLAMQYTEQKFTLRRD